MRISSLTICAYTQNTASCKNSCKGQRGPVERVAVGAVATKGKACVRSCGHRKASTKPEPIEPELREREDSGREGASEGDRCSCGCSARG